MPRNNRHAKNAHQHESMRRDIANQAARLMAEGGVADFALAKRKAARQLGAPDSEALPSNREVEEALRDYQAVFQEDELRERLDTLRGEALVLMRKLERFAPCLTGAVLAGIAGRYAEAEIEVFADSGKDVEIFLLNSGIAFEHVDSRRTGPDAPELRLRIYGEESSVLLSVYPAGLERVRRRNPHTGEVAGRAGIDALSSLLDRP